MNGPTSPMVNGSQQQKALEVTETALWKEYDRLKGILKERDIALLRLKEENAVLKQIDRRHQRELTELEAQNEEAPRIIRGLRDEIQGLKNKLKESYAFQGTQDRRIRHLAEQVDQAKQDNSRLQELVTQQDLKVRSELQEEINQCHQQVSEHEATRKETEHKCELMEKNFATESMNLRIKIRSLENENQLFKDKIQKQENLIREKDKDIASLSIYKYNALHRKPEPCKACQKRQMEERELHRRNEILAALPKLPKPRVKVTSASSVQVHMDLPPLSSKCQYDRVHLTCSTNEDMTRPRTFKLVPGVSATFEIAELPTGRFSFFRAVAFFKEFSSEPSEHETAFVDMLPSPPTAPTLYPARAVRIYQSNNGSKFYLAAEVQPAANQIPPAQVSWDIVNPDLAVPYWFCASVINELGESAKSEVAGPITLDFPPDRPGPPNVKRHGVDSVQVSIIPPKSRGESDVVMYRVSCHTVSASDDEKEVDVPSGEFNSHGYVVIDGLDVGEHYVFAVTAKNAAGWGEKSAFSEQVHLEQAPPITGYKLWMSRRHDLSDMAVVCPFIPTQPNMTSEHLFDKLEVGGNYWFAASLLGPSQESGLSAAVWVCLAAAIPLPPTPRPLTPKQQPAPAPAAPLAPVAPPPSNLNRATSRSIDLSVAQRVQNLFRGNPAFAIPDDIRMQAEADGVQVFVTNGYTSPAAMGKHRGSLESLSGGGFGSRKDLAAQSGYQSGSGGLAGSIGGAGGAAGGNRDTDGGPTRPPNANLTSGPGPGSIMRTTNQGGAPGLGLPSSAERRRAPAGQKKAAGMTGKRVMSRNELANRH
ncbi:ciliary protein causing Leber congenital amaurosis disease-domain-containing protein [Catenaria anguillulae PL171]|uniref:Ciliary protein causing Leber congenital amaurosis disease-domain-containing protein n=1 Tax=Catenaria anguillulae PL171 TaxID=765915 RepID=A0A1Y2HU45_9FUNG|nr:ciliary protein causing Leber congenital amaurosis disease-domain-containing protein [Catenaria anguillulae PL171]